MRFTFQTEIEPIDGSAWHYDYELPAVPAEFTRIRRELGVALVIAGRTTRTGERTPIGYMYGGIITNSSTGMHLLGVQKAGSLLSAPHIEPGRIRYDYPFARRHSSDLLIGNAMRSAPWSMNVAGQLEIRNIREYFTPSLLAIRIDLAVEFLA